MDRLGGGQVWGRNAPGRDLGTPRHKAQRAPRGFHFCAVFAFSHAVLRAGCTLPRRFSSSSRNAANPDSRILLRCVCSALRRCAEAGVESPAAHSLSLPRRTPQSRVRTYTKVKTPHLILRIMSTNDKLKWIGRCAFIGRVSTERDSTIAIFRGPSKSLAAHERRLIIETSTCISSYSPWLRWPLLPAPK